MKRSVLNFDNKTLRILRKSTQISGIGRSMLQQAIPQQKSTNLLGLVPANVSHPFSRPGQNERWRYLHY